MEQGKSSRKIRFIQIVKQYYAYRILSEIHSNLNFSNMIMWAIFRIFPTQTTIGDGENVPVTQNQCRIEGNGLRVQMSLARIARQTSKLGLKIAIISKSAYKIKHPI